MMAVGPGLVHQLLGVGEEVLAGPFVVVLGDVAGGDVAEAVTEVHLRARHAVLEADHVAADHAWPSPCGSTPGGYGRA